MTTKTKKQGNPNWVKKENTETVTQTVEKPTPKKSYKLPSFGKNKIEKPHLYRLNPTGAFQDNGLPKYPVTYMLKAEEVIYDPETDSERTIRYIPGETSIYKEEQSRDSKLREPIVFYNGALTVDKSNPTLRKFLELSNRNKDNKHRKPSVKASFFKFSSERDAKKDIQKSRSEVEAMHLALTMDLDKLIGYAKILGINVNNSVDEIRYDMKNLAKQNPQSFIDGLNDPRTEVKEIILKAKENNIINIGGRDVTWTVGNDKTPICFVPIGVKGVDKMVDFCLEDEGGLILDEIKKRLDKFA